MIAAAPLYTVEGTVTLSTGQTTAVVEEERPTDPVPIPPKLLKDMMNCGPVNGGSIQGSL